MALNRPIVEWTRRRVWIVGASSGIGAALASALAARGARLALSARRGDRLAAVAEACVRQGSPEVRVEVADVTRVDDLVRVRTALVAEWGGIDLVVFAAGVWHPMHAWELTPDAVRATFETNLSGLVGATAVVTPQLLQQGEGALAIVSSVAGYRGLPRALAYGPSKAALINFAEGLYLDLAPRGVSVFLICPGFVDTPLTAGNDFPMPSLVSAERAADEIVRGLARGSFEIHFPRRFTRLMKLMRLLPYRLYFPLVRRVTERG